jgi:uncharacterized protein (DUF2252 family)
MRESDELIERIKRFNRDRDPHLLQRKYAAMASDAFSFYRGTCHLFYEDWPRRSALNRAPLVWLSGDLHPENFGSFRGNDGAVCFDVNDFDEAVLGICLWDVVRCVAGIIIGSRSVGVLDDDALALSRRYVYAYRANLGEGTPRAVTSDESRGMVHDLLQGIRTRSNEELVDARTTSKRKQRRIVVDGVHAASLTDGERKRAEQIFDRWNESRKRKLRFELVDVAERIAGTGSLGVARYVALALRKGAWHLLDIKHEPASAAQPYARARQLHWECEAARVVWVQARAQADPPSLLTMVDEGRQSFVVKELQPTDDRLHWQKWHGKLDRLERVMSTMGELTAWSHVRCAGKRGAASESAIKKFASKSSWVRDALTYAGAYAAKVESDYARFCEAYDAGVFAARSRR